SLIQSEKYLLTCYRYIELNPVRAGMVAHPAQYQKNRVREQYRLIFERQSSDDYVLFDPGFPTNQCTWTPAFAGVPIFSVLY
ncbi:MAG: hypothetical protein ABFS23_13560, partial [Pseudomonadota bacterium]